MASDQTFALALSENVELLGQPKYRTNIEEARLIVFEDDFLLHDRPYQLDSGWLATAVNLSEGKKYEFVLEVEGFPLVSAMDSMPAYKPEFELTSISAQGEYEQLELLLKDRPEQEWYMLELYFRSFTEQAGDTNWYIQPLNFSSADKLFVSNVNTINANNHFALFDDRLIQGQNRSLTINYKSSSLNQFPERTPVELIIELRSVSSQYFEFYLDLLENNHIYGGPLASSVRRTSNISGGLGVFGCYTRKIIYQDL